MTWGNQYSRQIDDPEAANPVQSTANPGHSTANPGQQSSWWAAICCRRQPAPGPGQATAHPGQQPSCWEATRRWLATCCRRQTDDAGPQLVPTADGQQDPASLAIPQTEQGKSAIHINPIIKYYQLKLIYSERPQNFAKSSHYF